MTSREEYERWHAVSWRDSRNVSRYWPLSDVPEVREAQLEVGPGKCCFCERPLKRPLKGRPPVICFRLDCDLAYHRAYGHQEKRLIQHRTYWANFAAKNKAKGLRTTGKPRTGRKTVLDD